MLKLNQNTKNKLNSFLSLLVIIILIVFNRSNIVYAANNNWVEITKSPLGIQYVDRDSLKKKDKGLIEITTKYVKIESNNSNDIEEYIYAMKINCSTNKFKDISVNGKKNLSAKWIGPNGDKLISDVISDTCKNV